MRNCRTVGMLLVAASLAASDPSPPRAVSPHKLPSVTIAGAADPVSPGELVILNAQVDESGLPDDLVTIQVNWVVLDAKGKPKTSMSGDDGRSIAFSAGASPTTITVITTVNCLYETKKSATVLDANGKPVQENIVVDAASVSSKPIVTVMIVGDGPAPAPQPTPDPGPNLPQGAYGLAPFTYQTFMSSNDMTDAEKAAVAKALAIGFGGIAAKINANPAYADIPTIIADLKVYNDQNLVGTGVPAAKTAVVQSILKARLAGLVRDRRVVTASQFAVAFQEIARGLTAITNK